MEEASTFETTDIQQTEDLAISSTTDLTISQSQTDTGMSIYEIANNRFKEEENER